MSSPETVKPLKRQTLASALLEDLRRRILALDIAEGTQLRQDEVAKTYGISRIPVREALLQLEAEGLVQATHHRGYTVTRLSLDDIGELFDLRALIEVDLLEHAIPAMQASAIQRARETLNRFDQLLTHRIGEHKWGELNWELHSALYAPARRERSLQIAHNLHRNTDRYLRLQLQLTSQTIERAREEHKTLVDLCAQREQAHALEYLRRHIVGARDDLLEFLKQRRLSDQG